MERPDLVRSHDPCDAMLTASFASLSKIQEDSSRPVDAMACIVRGADQPQQPHVFLGPVGKRLSQPSVISGACDIQDPAHGLDVVFMAMRFYELIDSTGTPRSRSAGHLPPLRPALPAELSVHETWELQ